MLSAWLGRRPELGLPMGAHGDGPGGRIEFPLELADPIETTMRYQSPNRRRTPRVRTQARRAGCLPRPGRAVQAFS